MDERDFAELISVFLKGSESDTAPDTLKKEIADSAATNTSSNEAEIRKNIIEALAERIKESQDKATVPEESDKPVTDPDELGELKEESKIIDLNSEPEETVNNEVSTAADSADMPDNIVESATAEYNANRDKAELKTAITVDEELITDEEVARLLNGDEQKEAVPLQRILHNFLKLDGIIAALVISRDGFTVDYVSSIELDLDMISAIVATGFNSLDRIGHELERGDLQIAMLEYLNGPIVLSPLANDIVLVVVASQWATLGRVRWEIKKRANELIVNL